ncbi:MAG: hypothetical protein ACLQLO_10010 [Mycobacterium sp.]
MPDIPFATLTYRTVQNDKPDRITLQATDQGDAEKFAKAMGNNVENFAFVDSRGSGHRWICRACQHDNDGIRRL